MKKKKKTENYDNTNTKVLKNEKKKNKETLFELFPGVKLELFSYSRYKVLVYQRRNYES